MCSSVTFQVKSIIETFSAEGAEISFDVTVALHVPVEEPLEREGLATHATGELAGVRLAPHGGQLLNIFLLRDVTHHRILNSVSSVDNLQRSIRWYSELKRENNIIKSRSCLRWTYPLLQYLNSHLKGRNVHQIFLVVGRRRGLLSLWRGFEVRRLFSWRGRAWGGDCSRVAQSRLLLDL